MDCADNLLAVSLRIFQYNAHFLQFFDIIIWC